MEALFAAMLAVHLIALTLLVLYGINCHFLVLCFRRLYPDAGKRHAAAKERFYRELPARGWPRVTVQLPLYNEYYVVERLVESVGRMDYPRDRLEVQILDDSTDETSELVSAAVARWQARGLDIACIHREHRKGFKAGALQGGLDSAAGEYFAIFDADFVPPPDFLKESLPYFSDPRVGMLQARWGHLNADYSLLTKVQSIGIDGHFTVEQSSRAWTGLFLTFNGAAGVWRRRAIEEAGGWQADTLTEDLDLSYRAQLKGWRLMFTPQIVCPGEVPVTITAFKSQQHRWAKGSIQAAKKYLPRVLRARLPVRVKIQAILHLTHYLVHPLMLVVVLMSLPMLHLPWQPLHWTGPALLAGLLWLSTTGPSSLYLESQRFLYRDWKRRLRYFPALMCLGTGIAVNNTGAVLEGLLNIRGVFVRTPKYGIRKPTDTWMGSRYGLPLTATTLAEFALGSYSLLTLSLFAASGKFLPIPFLLIYALGFFYIFVLSLRHSGRDRRPRISCEPGKVA